MAIPGAHDAAAFGSDLFSGEAFVPATATPFEHYVVVSSSATARGSRVSHTPRARPRPAGRPHRARRRHRPGGARRLRRTRSDGGTADHGVVRPGQPCHDGVRRAHRRPVHRRHRRPGGADPSGPPGRGDGPHAGGAEPRDDRAALRRSQVGLATRLLNGEPGFLLLDDGSLPEDGERPRNGFDVLGHLATEGWQIFSVTAKDEIGADLVAARDLRCRTLDRLNPEPGPREYRPVDIPVPVPLVTVSTVGVKSALEDPARLNRAGSHLGRLGCFTTTVEPASGYPDGPPYPETLDPHRGGRVRSAGDPSALLGIAEPAIPKEIGGRLMPVATLPGSGANLQMIDSGLVPRVVAAWKRAFGEETDDRAFTAPPNSGQRCPLCGASVNTLHAHLGTPDGEGCPETPMQRDAPSP